MFKYETTPCSTTVNVSELYQSEIQVHTIPYVYDVTHYYRDLLKHPLPADDARAIPPLLRQHSMIFTGTNTVELRETILSGPILTV